MYFADLSPYSYHGDPELESLNVGWLDKARGYPRGPVPAGFLEHLVEICKRPAKQHRGFHVCEFCDFGPEPASMDQAVLNARYELQKAAGALSSTEIRVVGRDGRVYASPALICHYVLTHSYQPPQEFVEAVMGTDLGQILTMWPNPRPANRRHAGQSDGSGRFVSDHCSRSASPAVTDIGH